MLRWQIPILAISILLTPIHLSANTVVHTVYAASALSKGGLQLEWDETPGGWVSKNSLRHSDFRDGCNSLLSHQQMFALREMEKRGILTAAQVTDYSKLGNQLSPRQISFFEQIHDHREVASLWSISGQDYENGIKTRILPWMLEPKWKDLALQIDRKKYPFLWEWGRAAQVEAGDIDTLLNFATQKAYRELRSLGGDVKDAFITVHAISPAHTLSYLRRFPGTQFSKNAVRDGDSILLIPLSDILKVHTLSKSSALIRDLNSIIADQRFADNILVDLIESFRGTLWIEADWRGLKRSSPHPILIQDFSAWGVNSIHAQLRDSGIGEVKSKAAVERLLQMPLTKRLRKASRYIDATESKGAGILSHDRSAIEVSGLDPAQLLEDPFYVNRVLFSVAAATVTQARAIFPNTSIKDIWAKLITQNNPISIATRNPEISEAARRLRPDDTKKWVTDSVGDVPKEIRDALGDDWGTTTDVHFFSFGRILQLTMEDPRMDEVFRSSVDRLTRGQHQIDYNLIDPDLF